ncbi:HK97 gp10 family phage protein [Rubellimicrobium arenae]|uniref:HK97 gp10 family phage protein n=1 Tax=Rubellimicrobium arenae TaxID=2817372 RepID=UPI001B31260A|nr:HK97 gp10 family phage protein [Rubellimicrobium arenae]
MARGGFRVDGASDLKAQLDRLRRGAGRAALERAGTSAMEPMARLARQLAPKDTHELAESIDVGTEVRDEEIGRFAYRLVMGGGGSREQALAAMRDARRAAGGAARNVYVDVFMGPVAGRDVQDVIKGVVQEFGSETREPQPYMRPAFDQDSEALLERLRKDLWFEILSAIENAARRGTLKG